MHTLLITYLLRLIKYQRYLIYFLMSQLVNIYGHSKMPKLDKPRYIRFNEFEVDELTPIVSKPAEQPQLNYQSIIAEQLATNGVLIKPINRQSSRKLSFAERHCPQCQAPSTYLYANNGRGGQLKCKVCQFKFQESGERTVKDVVFRCPYCKYELTLRHARVKFDVLVCPNLKCPHRLKAIANLDPVKLAAFNSDPSRVKVRYSYRNFKFDLKSLAQDSPIQAPVDLSKIHVSPYVLGLILTFRFNYGLSARNTAGLMYDLYGIKISHQTILNYEGSVATVLRPFWANYPYQLSNELVGDETYVRVHGKWNYAFYFFDAKNKLILADYTTPERTTESAVKAIFQVLNHVPEIPEDFHLVVDGNPVYKVAQIAFAREGINFGVVQVPGLHNQDQVSVDNRYLKQTIERFNRAFKSHYRSSTGFGSASGAKSYITLFSAAYNFLRPHSALNYQVPVSIPEIQAQKLMPHKWLALIELAQNEYLAK